MATGRGSRPFPAPLLLLALVALTAAACGGGGGGDDLIIGAATSVQDPGLLDELVARFRDERPEAGGVKPIAAGSGQLVELARRGEVDVLITHSPQAEAELIAGGDGVDRRPFMHNFFVIVGPEDDPADVASSESIAEAFEFIAGSESTFVSRGDNSGTHVRELAIWADAGIDPSGAPWYQESGVGQGQSLQIVSDKGAYTLVDSSTLVTFRGNVELTSYFTDASAPNVYSVTLVNPEKHDVNADAARQFADFLTSPEGQLVIEEFGRDDYGERLFVPGSPSPRPTPSPTP